MVSGPPRPLRLGVVSYLNAAPLVYGLRDDPAFRLVMDVPARVGEALERGEIDVGLIPSVDYARGDYAIVPGIAVASRGPVRSVNLYHRGPLAAVRRVAVDASSHASAVLLRVLLHARLDHEPEYVTLPPDPRAMLAQADAALLIGDPALYFEGDHARLDLGEAWREDTALPFVFAFWAGRREALDDAVVARLQAAARAGLAALPAVAASYNGHGAGRALFNEAYLRENIVYTFGEGEVAGLREFYRRAHALGLLPRAAELRFHGRP